MKKTDELSLEKTIAFAKQCYGDKVSILNVNVFEHCKFVARQAETIAVKLFDDLRPDYFSEKARDTIITIVHCAVLHDVLNLSTCAFENVAEVTNVQIAAMVANISRDYRLVETKRDIEFRGRLSLSNVGAQIVSIADAICTTKEVLAAIDKTGMAIVPKAKKILTQLDGDLLALHATNKYYTLRMFAHAAKNMMVDAGQQIKRCRQHAKTEKNMLQITQRLQRPQNDAGSNTDTTPETKLVKKKREVRYAKKRNSGSDS